MNQILKRKDQNLEINPNFSIEKINKNSNYSSKKNFEMLFIFSIFSFFIVFFLFFSHQYSLQKKEQLSHKLVENYSILRLYSSPGDPSSNASFDEDSFTIGTIEIPKLNLSYPILSHLTDDFLKIAPCRFYGEMPNQLSNLCIAGHNYDNQKFFSHIASLKTGDTIFLIDSQNNKFTYLVSDQYEVKANDLSPIYEKAQEIPLLTLVTCNNFTKNRIIVKAKMKNFSK